MAKSGLNRPFSAVAKSSGDVAVQHGRFWDLIGLGPRRRKEKVMEKEALKRGWTEGFGQFVAVISTLYGFVSRVWSSMGIGFEIVPWLKSEKGKASAERALRSIGEVFLEKRWEAKPAEKADGPTVGKFFMTVKLGMYKNIDALVGALLKNEKKITPQACVMMDNIELSQVEKEVDIWEVTARDLGFTNEKVGWVNLCMVACQHGFEKCLAEVGPMALLQSHDNKKRFVAMTFVERFTNSKGFFYIVNQSLYEYSDIKFHHSHVPFLVELDEVVLFVLPRREKCS